MTTPQKHHKEIIAWAFGALIEKRDQDLPGMGWDKDPNPTWSSCFEYRIAEVKPADIVVIQYVTYTNHLGLTSIANFGKPNKVKFTFDRGTRELISVEHLKS